MSVKTQASWNAYCSEHTAWDAIRTHSLADIHPDQVTSATEMESALISSAAAVGALSVWAGL